MSVGQVKDFSERYTLYDAANLGASVAAANALEVRVGDVGILWLQCLIDNVDGLGGAPADTPVGTWLLHASADGVRYSPLVSTYITAQLAVIAPNGNNLVSAWARFKGAGAKFFKVAYTRSSGGGTSTRCTLYAVTR